MHVPEQTVGGGGNPVGFTAEAVACGRDGIRARRVLAGAREHLEDGVSHALEVVRIDPHELDQDSRGSADLDQLADSVEHLQVFGAVPTRGTGGEVGEQPRALELLHQWQVDARSRGQIVERVRRVTTEIGGAIGKELRDKAAYAILFSTLGLLIYIAVRFDLKFGIAAAIATFHDVLVVMGIVWLSGIEISLLIITALLTLAGYSLTDTVVVFDRIRENLKANRSGTLGTVINASINQVLSRTIIVSLTTLLVLVALYFLGGRVLQDFAFALGMGVIVGTYSSIYIAAPITEWMDTRFFAPAREARKAELARQRKLKPKQTAAAT